MKRITTLLTLLLFVCKSLFSQETPERFTVREEFMTLPLDSLILWVYPTTERGFTFGNYTVEISAKNKWESKSKSDDNTWPEKLPSIINSMKALPDFMLTFNSLQIKQKGGQVIKLPPFILTFDPQSVYPVKGDVVKAKKEWLQKQQAINKPTELHGKLLVSHLNTIAPLKNGTLELLSKGKVVKVCKTNQYGDFDIEVPVLKDPYELNVPKDQPGLSSEDKVLLAKQNGVVMKEFVKNGKGDFVFELLPADIVVLSVQKEEDPLIDLDNLIKRNQGKETSVVKSITFDVGSSDIKAESKPDLDKVSTWLKANPNYKLKVLGFTDSKGDAESNLKLSERRVQSIIAYLSIQGIPAGRLEGKGMGEAKLLNRCNDGVECSELEHALNRRVEFVFIK